MTSTLAPLKRANEGGSDNANPTRQGSPPSAGTPQSVYDDLDALLYARTEALIAKALSDAGGSSL
jgi:hypothetical protein